MSNVLTHVSVVRLRLFANPLSSPYIYFIPADEAGIVIPAPPPEVVFRRREAGIFLHAQMAPAYRQAGLPAPEKRLRQAGNWQTYLFFHARMAPACA